MPMAPPVMQYTGMPYGMDPMMGAYPPMGGQPMMPMGGQQMMYPPMGGYA
jgi:hypothetical protein